MRLRSFTLIFVACLFWIGDSVSHVPITESVYLRFGNEERGKYGRLLAYVYRAPDGLFVNLEIVRQGYGHAYTKFPSSTWRYFGNMRKRLG